MLFKEEISQEYAQELFTDSEKVLKFIADVKWKDGFTCRNCGHTNFCEGKSPSSRRCTRCKKEESATANTIFHNIKFPINKAFYMIFLVYSSNGTISSHKLSEILGIRQSTCWAYSSKIKKAMREYARIHKNAHQHGWDSILMVQENA